MTDLTREFRFMREALRVSLSALLVNEVPIGCIFVLDGEIIAGGFNQTNISLCGIRHAELVAIESIYKSYSNKYTKEEITNKIFPRCEVFVSVEPCIMCASALRQLKIKRVFFGCGNDRFGGNGTVASCNKGSPSESIEFPREYPSYPGILQKEAILLLRRFYVQENEKAPTPKVKKNRNLVEDEFPPLAFNKYLTREEFVEFYGVERVNVFDGDADEIEQFIEVKLNSSLGETEFKKRKI